MEQSNQKKTDLNPRGIARPHDGRGQGKGMSGGQRGGKNRDECNTGGPGRGQGGGKGQGRNRKG